jgi:hypothetical protein
VLGNLGSLDRAQGRMDEARAAFVEGERLLRQVGDRLELAKLLCGRVMLEVAGGLTEPGAAFLAEAEAIGVDSGVGPESELGRLLTMARAAMRTS